LSEPENGALNPISKEIKTGTIGELLVQIRLLQYNVQAAPPLKDTGNDLIAVKDREFRAISVRTTTRGTLDKPADQLYDILAVVHLIGTERELDLDKSDVFLIPRGDVTNASTSCEKLGAYKLSPDLVSRLFRKKGESRPVVTAIRTT
jgi:hypothetical protein